MYQIIQKRKILMAISLALCSTAIIFLIVWPLKPGIDFEGGTMMELSFSEAISPQEIEEKLAPLNLGEVKINKAGENSYILRLGEIDEKTHQEILSLLGNPQQERYEIIGPTIGQEIRANAQTAIILAIIFIFLYVAWAFRKLSHLFGRQKSWRYGLGAILALAHDVLIISGFFALLGFFKGAEVNTLFIVAILTTLGYSVNDTVVVFDRIRENTLLYGRDNFEDVVNRSLNESLVRSLNTSLTTIFVLLAIGLFAGADIQIFAWLMIVGVISGTWSSFVIASPFVLGNIFSPKPKQIKSN